MPEQDVQRGRPPSPSDVSVFVCVCTVASHACLIAKGRWGDRNNKTLQGGWRIQISLAEFMNDWDQRGTWTDVCALLRACLPSRIPSDDTVVLKQRERDGDEAEG